MNKELKTELVGILENEDIYIYIYIVLLELVRWLGQVMIIMNVKRKRRMEEGES